jgi:hypothetical protein
MPADFLRSRDSISAARVPTTTTTSSSPSPVASALGAAGSAANVAVPSAAATANAQRFLFMAAIPGSVPRMLFAIFRKNK